MDSGSRAVRRRDDAVGAQRPHFSAKQGTVRRWERRRRHERGLSKVAPVRALLLAQFEPSRRDFEPSESIAGAGGAPSGDHPPCVEWPLIVGMGG
jgi:hypothetical protein